MAGTRRLFSEFMLAQVCLVSLNATVVTGYTVKAIQKVVS